METKRGNRFELCGLDVYTDNELYYARIEVKHPKDRYMDEEQVGPYEISRVVYLEVQKMISEGKSIDDAYRFIAPVFDAKVDEWVAEYDQHLAKEDFDALTSDEMMTLHNDYCDSIKDADGKVFHMSDGFFDKFFSGRPSDLMRAICFGEVVPSHKFIKFDGYGNLKTATRIWELVNEGELFEYYLETIKG